MRAIPLTSVLSHKGEDAEPVSMGAGMGPKLRCRNAQIKITLICGKSGY